MGSQREEGIGFVGEGQEVYEGCPTGSFRLPPPSHSRILCAQTQPTLNTRLTSLHHTRPLYPYPNTNTNFNSPCSATSSSASPSSLSPRCSPHRHLHPTASCHKASMSGPLKSATSSQDSTACRSSGGAITGAKWHSRMTVSSSSHLVATRPALHGPPACHPNPEVSPC